MINPKLKLNKNFYAQVDLLLRILPYVAEEESLALKGGTAINMFIWDMPRLSVDIDLTYIEFYKREQAIENIAQSIKRIKNKLIKAIPNIKTAQTGKVEDQEEKLICNLNGVIVKIEINTIMRGVINPPVIMPVTHAVQTQFGKFADIKVISKGELFGGKICAALDRQHPRDLFDVHYLLNEEGITNEIKEGFIAALLSHPRPLNEMLNPNLGDQRELFEKQFEGMTLRNFTYQNFEDTRKRLIEEIHSALEEQDKEFLLSFKSGIPKWDLSPIKVLKDLPAVQWKLKNMCKLIKTNPKKHTELYEKLNQVLLK